MAADAGFRVLRSSEVSRVGFLRIEAIDLETPGGEVVERIAVRHPGAVAVLPIDGDEIILIRQYRAPLGAALLEVPAGKLDVAGEPSAETAGRELEEEIGLRPGSLERIAAFWTTPGFTDEHIELFVATDLQPAEHRPHGAEEMAAEIVRFPIAEVAGMLDRGEVTDVKTVVALQWLLLHR